MKKLILLTTFVVLLVGVVGIYKYWILRGELSREAATSSQNVTSYPTPLSRNAFSFSAKKGEKFGDLTVKSVQPYEPREPIAEDNLKVEFSGSTTIEGTYTISDIGIFGEAFPEDPGEGYVCFESTDSRIPIYQGYPKADFCFENRDFAEKAFRDVFGKKMSGSATIVIDHYTFQAYQIELWSTARLVSVVE